MLSSRTLLGLALALLSGCVEQPRQPTVDLKSEQVDLEPLKWFSRPKSTVGALVYVPIYSSTYHQSGRAQHLLTATLSIHNLSLAKNIELTAVTYFDTSGRRLTEFVPKGASIGPFETRQFVIPQDDQSGGTGANFVVKWESAEPVPSPVIEALMISTTGQLGISFTTQGTVIQALKHAKTATASRP